MRNQAPEKQCGFRSRLDFQNPIAVHFRFREFALLLINSRAHQQCVEITSVDRKGFVQIRQGGSTIVL